MPEENMENTKLLPLGTEQGLEETEYPSFDLCLGENMVSPLVAQHRQWLKTIRHEVPNPKIPFKVQLRSRVLPHRKNPQIYLQPPILPKLLAARTVLLPLRKKELFPHPAEALSQTIRIPAWTTF